MAASGMRTERLTVVEPETQLGYAALHRLLLLFPEHIERVVRAAIRSNFLTQSGAWSSVAPSVGGWTRPGLVHGEPPATGG
jgi:hypothetical protein